MLGVGNSIMLVCWTKPRKKFSFQYILEKDTLWIVE